MPDLINVTITMEGFLDLDDNTTIPLKPGVQLDYGDLTFVARDAKTVFSAILSEGYVSPMVEFLFMFTYCFCLLLQAYQRTTHWCAIHTLQTYPPMAHLSHSFICQTLVLLIQSRLGKPFLHHVIAFRTEI